MPNFDTVGGSGRVTVRCEINAIQNDPANNRTLVRIAGRVFDSSASLGGFGTGTWNVVLDGSTRGSGSFSYQFAGNSGANYLFYQADHWIGHNTNGTRSVSGSATFDGRTSLIRSITAGGTIGLTDYDRRPVFSDSTLASPATRGTAYSNGVSASLTSSYSIVSGALPNGISLNTSTGAVSGTPTVVGTFNFSIRANGSAEGSTTIARTIVVNPALPSFTDSTVVSTASVGTAYSDGVSATETASYSVFSGALPGGITLNTTTGAITGTPTTPGVFNFVIRATNVTGTRNTGTLTITVTSGAKVWNGTAFVAGTTRAWNGTAFVSTTTRVWNGSAWTSAT